MSCLLYPSCLYPRVISSKCKATSRLDVVPSGRFLDRAILYANLDRCHTRWQANNAIPQFAIGEASGSFPLGLIASGVIGIGLFVAGLRAYCYSQLTYVTASMLANSMPKKDLRIIQIGGGIKELYYYPSTTVQVTVIDENAKEGLLQEAGVQAGVPVVCRKESIAALGRMVKSSADAIVLLSTMQHVKDMSAFLKDCHAVLKPGGRLIFIQAVKDGESASPVQSVVGTSTQALDLNKLEPLKGGEILPPWIDLTVPSS